MKPPAQIWETEYQHDRRKHRHRCACCRRIINAGEAVLMLRRDKGSLALHQSCADQEHSAGNTWRDAFAAWEAGRQRAMGFKVPLHRMEMAA